MSGRVGLRISDGDDVVALYRDTDAARTAVWKVVIHVLAAPQRAWHGVTISFSVLHIFIFIFVFVFTFVVLLGLS